MFVKWRETVACHRVPPMAARNSKFTSVKIASRLAEPRW